jgi:tetratricopeptide (TPR) repeat protein
VLGQLIDADPNPIYYYVQRAETLLVAARQLGCAAYDNNKSHEYDESIDNLLEMMRQDYEIVVQTVTTPNTHAESFALATALVYTNRYEQALQVVNTIADEQAEVFELKALILTKLKQFEEAVEFYNKTMEKIDSPAERKFIMYKQEICKATKSHPKQELNFLEETWAQCEMIETYVAKDDVEIDYSSIAAFTSSILQLRRAKRYEEMIRIANELLEKDKNSTHAFWTLAEAYQGMGETTKSIQSWENVLASTQTHIFAVAALRTLIPDALHSENYDKAVKYCEIFFERADECDPSDIASAARAYLYALINLKQVEKVVEFAKKPLFHQISLTEEEYVMVLQALQHLQEYKEMLKVCKTAMRVHPTTKREEFAELEALAEELIKSAQ